MRLFFRSMLVTLLVFSISSFAKSNESTHQLATTLKVELTKQRTMPQVDAVTEDNAAGGLIWKETFEAPASLANWTSFDNTLPRPEPDPAQWVVDSWQAYETTAWRCADLSLGDNGGYDNHWYQVLDTPPLMLTEDATLTFYHRYSVENPAGASDPYDAWDGMNVRVSMDNGTTWDVLPVATYNVTSIWAFGHPDQGHNEGPGIAGWAGANDTWTMETVDLSAYTSSETEVMIRFAFASDQAYSTSDGDPSMYGWQIDNIEISSANTVFFTNAGVDENMTAKSNEYIPPAGGDLWHIARIVDEIPALYPEFTPVGQGYNHALVCQNSGQIFDAEATYNPYMDNIVFTGPISIPDIAPVYLDYKYVPFFLDGNDFPDVEFFRPEVSVDGENWEPIEANPYVYSFAYDQWLEFSWLYGYPTNMSMFDLSRFAGQDIYISFRFWSDYDTPYGSGLMIDDIAIYSPTRYIPAPQNLAANANMEDGTIELSWTGISEDAITDIYRQIQGQSNYTWIASVSGTETYADAEVEAYISYNYAITSTVKYNGTSGAAGPVSAEIIPAGVSVISYDDGIADSSVVSDANMEVAVHFVPDSYPVNLEALKIFLVKGETTGTAAQFSIYADDGTNGEPGSRLARLNKSGLVDGFNVVVLSSSVEIEEGGFYIAYKRYGDGLHVGVDFDAPIDGNTYISSSTGWEQKTTYDAIMHAYVDTTSAVSVDMVSAITEKETFNPEEFTLLKNYPNPFNPSTTISFNIPAKIAGERISLIVYNALGEKVNTLYKGAAIHGLNTMQWHGVNDAGSTVNSGIYFVRLQSVNKSLTQRLLLLK